MVKKSDHLFKAITYGGSSPREKNSAKKKRACLTKSVSLEPLPSKRIGIFSRNLPLKGQNLERRRPEKIFSHDLRDRLGPHQKVRRRAIP